jgi:hypothetical protein
MLCGLLVQMSTEVQAAYDRRVVVYNNTSSTMRAFHASNIGTVDWQEDILGTDVLRPGRRVRINIDDGTGYCRFDFKAVFSDGTKVIRRNVNVCEVGSWTISD